MKKISFKIILLLVTYLNYNKSFSQINLVPNPYFEDIKQGYSCGVATLFWNYCDSWFPPTQGTPDLFSRTCPVNNPVYVPNNYFGYQYPRNGNNYVGASLISTNNGTGSGREYISVKLENTLISGRIYCVRLFANLAKF